MKQIYLIRQQAPRLLLFFAGWGADETPFRAYRPKGCDFLLCYDYRALDFDITSLAQPYREVNVVGWSMGVWAASQMLPLLSLPIQHSVAINGTPFPIDAIRGIPPAIYQGTREGFCEASLHKFLRRMCADTAAFRAFLQVTPHRPLDELREELAEIQRQCATLPPAAFHWDEAVVGRNDRIIPPANQLHAWQALGVPVCRTDDAHYQEALLRHYLQDRWTSD